MHYLLYGAVQIAVAESAMGLCVTPYPPRKIAYNVASIPNRMLLTREYKEPIALSGARTGLASVQPESRGRWKALNDGDVRA